MTLRTNDANTAVVVTATDEYGNSVAGACSARYRWLVPRQATFARQGAASGACSRRAGRKSSYWTY
ncbi:hypothetical protein, partial [Streptomyces sp. NPDC050263]|uniref:hypothetical protein n=1 Tax=Streptomyces sp. NPDC050263 TaxID=3155037 RepID=UPI003443B3AB